MRRLALVTPLALAALFAVGPLPLTAQSATEVFRRFEGQVWRVEVVEAQTGAQSSLGTGFLTGEDGRLVTGFHVSGEYLRWPERFRLQVTHQTRRARDATVIGVDPVSDLAVLQLEGSFDILPDERLEVLCTARCQGKTGVEMEAMTGAAVAALTIYDMTKALSKGIVIERVELLRKTGGKSGDWNAPARA